MPERVSPKVSHRCTPIVNSIGNCECGSASPACQKLKNIGDYSGKVEKVYTLIFLEIALTQPYLHLSFRWNPDLIWSDGPQSGIISS